MTIEEYRVNIDCLGEQALMREAISRYAEILSIREQLYSLKKENATLKYRVKRMQDEADLHTSQYHGMHYTK